MILFVSLFGGGAYSNGRPSTIYKRVANKKLFITSDFSHTEKLYRNIRNPHDDEVSVHVPSYSKNIGISRLWSHLVFAYRLRKILHSMKLKPSAIYCAMPSSSSAYVCARYCKNHQIKFIIDVIDLWPDSLLPLAKGKAIVNILLYPWKYITRYAYKSADVILGESVAYANEAKKCNSNAEVYPIYLGVDVDTVNKVKENLSIHLDKPQDEIWIAYAGSFKASNDLLALLSAIKELHGKVKYKLWLVGDGVERPFLEKYIYDNKLDAEITGFCRYQDLLSYLYYCDIAINIFKKGTKVVFSYKFNDYVAMNCFVLNSLEGETAEMVDSYHIGRNFDFDSHPLSEVLKDTILHWDIYSSWKKNSDRLVEEKLDKEKIYSVVDHVFSCG